MAPQAEVGIARDQHLLVHCAMWIVAGDAAFAHRTVLENKWPLLLGVALSAGFVLRLQIGAGTPDRISFMHIMAVGAAHLARQYRMAVGQAKFAAFIEMALKAGFGRRTRVHNRTFSAARLDVLAAGAMATLAAEAFGVLALHNELRVGRGSETFDRFFMALGAFLRTHKRSPSDLRRGDDRAINHSAGNKKHGPQGDTSENKCILRPTTRVLGHGKLGIDFDKLRLWFRSTFIMLEKLFPRYAFLAQINAINELNGRSLQNGPAEGGHITPVAARKYYIRQLG